MADNNTPLTLQFGYNAGIPHDTTAVWGARWIITQDGMVDDVPGRSDIASRNMADEERFVLHLLKMVKRKPHDRLRDMLRAGEVNTREAAEVVLFDDGIVRAVGNTNGSAGYFYVSVFLIPAPSATTAGVGERTGLTLDAIRTALDEVGDDEDADEQELALLRDLRDLTVQPPALFLLHISHKHGDAYSTHPTIESVVDTIDAWVDAEWDREMHGRLPHRPKPDDPKQARDEYFEWVEHESVAIVDLTTGQGVSLDKK